MEIIKTAIEGLLILQPRVFEDERGYFLELYSNLKYNSEIEALKFVQDNLSFSVKNVLRGLHYQVTKPQSKLISVIKGEILFKNTLKTEEGADIDGYIKRANNGKTNTEEDIAIEEIVERREDSAEPKIVPAVHRKEAV